MQQVQQQMIMNGHSGSLVEEEGRIFTRIEERRKQEDILWKQKSRVQWLWEGERNTCFFHKSMIQHRQHNRIFSLIDPGGNSLVQYEDMEAWLILGNDILEVVEESKRTRKVHPTLNSTFISLIPKSEYSEEPQILKPIALCNVIYKILSTIMVNQVKPILLALVSLKKTRFVKGYQILDNIVIDQEAIHSLKTLRSKDMMIKLDLSKPITA
eukprot:PITA_06797